jgi:hypothetical protein
MRLSGCAMVEESCAARSGVPIRGTTRCAELTLGSSCSAPVENQDSRACSESCDRRSGSGGTRSALAHQTASMRSWPASSHSAGTGASRRLSPICDSKSSHGRRRSSDAPPKVSRNRSSVGETGSGSIRRTVHATPVASVNVRKSLIQRSLASLGSESVDSSQRVCLAIGEKAIPPA